MYLLDLCTIFEHRENNQMLFVKYTGLIKNRHYNMPMIIF